MKQYILIGIIAILVASCGTRVSYTNQLRDEFGLESKQQIRKVQFFTSATIIMEKNKTSGNQSTDDDGALVSSSSKEQDRVIIPIGTKCIFDSYGDDEETLVLRFEMGQNKTITFAQRPGSSSGKYYLVADWQNGSGGRIRYGNETYNATSSSGTAYLQVVKKKLQKTKRKDRVVKGLKVD